MSFFFQPCRKSSAVDLYMSHHTTKPTKWVCAQRRLRSAWASAQADQSLRCPHEEHSGPQLPIKRTTKTLIRLGRCPGWSESSLGSQLFCWFCHHDRCAQQRLISAWTSAQSDQSAVCSMGSYGPKVSSCGQYRLWSDWADAQADLSLRWTHRTFCWFCRVASQMVAATSSALFIWSPICRCMYRENKNPLLISFEFRFL